MAISPKSDPHAVVEKHANLLINLNFVKQICNKAASMRREDCMTRLFWCSAFAFIGGCDLFDEVKETYEGLTNPLVVQSVVVGVEVDGVDPAVVDELNFEAGVAGTVFLADAKSASDLDNAPISGAAVTINAVSLADTGEGAYTLEPGALTYTNGATWTLEALIGTDSSSATFVPPPPPNATIPTVHVKGQPLNVSLAGQGFDVIVGVVADVATGEVTWSNEPEDISDIYNLATGNGDESIDIPGDAFPNSGAYVIGISGLTTSRTDQLDNMNTALSNIASGKMRLYPVAVP